MDRDSNHPMMDKVEVEAILDLLQNRIQGRAKALEFGCGGSTVTFSQYAANWISIEHDDYWAKRMRSALPSSSPVEILVSPPDFPHSGMTPAKEGQFKSYIASAKKICPEDGFDFVLVDGRARIDCILELHRSRLLGDGSIVVLHDFRRNRYISRLGEILEAYDLTSALTSGNLRGLGVFEYRGLGKANSSGSPASSSRRHNPQLST